MLQNIQFEFLNNEMSYDGTQLRPHFVLENTKKYGSCIVGFIGGCNVKTSELVDMEDRLNNDHILAKKMLHFIAEFYGTNLESTVLYQRLFMNHAQKILANEKQFSDIQRQGDDLMVGDAKLSVSIATASPVSTLIHWGINIDSTGAPVKAIGLNQLDWNEEKIKQFASNLVHNFIKEVNDIQMACVKVRAV